MLAWFLCGSLNNSILRSNRAQFQLFRCHSLSVWCLCECACVHTNVVCVCMRSHIFECCPSRMNAICKWVYFVVTVRVHIVACRLHVLCSMYVCVYL